MLRGVYEHGIGWILVNRKNIQLQTAEEDSLTDRNIRRQTDQKLGKFCKRQTDRDLDRQTDQQVLEGKNVRKKGDENVKKKGGENVRIKELIM